MHAFDVLGDPVRRRILELLAQGEQAAGSIAARIEEEFGITQAAVSQHLRVLRDSGFTRVRPEGPRRLYSIAPESFRGVDRWLDQFRVFWERRLDALETEVRRGQRERRERGHADGSGDAGGPS